MLKSSEIKDLHASVRSVRDFLPKESPVRYELTAALFHLNKAVAEAEAFELAESQRKGTNVIQLRRR
jgi:hypothetical protein